MFHKILPKIQPNLNLEQKTKTGFVLGIIGMVAWFIPILGLPIQIIGLTFSIKGLESSKKRLAKIGLVLSIIGIVNVVQNREKELPLVGSFAKHFTF